MKEGGIPGYVNAPCASKGEKMDSQFLTVREVGKILRLSQPTIYRLLKKKNGIPSHKIGGSWRFIEREVVRWVEERR